MPCCTFLPRARSDLRGIGGYIARDNRARAISFVEELQQVCNRLAEHPLMGRARPEFQPLLRSFPYGDYIIFYRPSGGGVQIVRILHAARDAKRQL
jgi:toxin ParE1/3/4